MIDEASRLLNLVNDFKYHSHPLCLKKIFVEESIFFIIGFFSSSGFLLFEGNYYSVDLISSAMKTSPCLAGFVFALLTPANFIAVSSCYV